MKRRMLRSGDHVKLMYSSGDTCSICITDVDAFHYYFLITHTAKGGQYRFNNDARKLDIDAFYQQFDRYNTLKVPERMQNEMMVLKEL